MHRDAIRLFAIALTSAALLLGGCASFNQVDNQVSTYGTWPAGAQPGPFVFERLPSQVVHPGRQDELENAARGVLEAKGFRVASEPGAADYLVQVGARVTSDDPWIHNAPLFYNGGFGYGYGGYGGGYGGYPFGYYGRGLGYGGYLPGYGFGPAFGFGYGGFYGPPNFEREVALVIRQRNTGQALYEARANNNGPSRSIDYLLPAMFSAAMQNFPVTESKPHQITTPISPR